MGRNIFVFHRQSFNCLMLSEQSKPSTDQILRVEQNLEKEVFDLHFDLLLKDWLDLEDFF